MTPIQFTELVTRMETMGGSFISALGLALRYADPKNRQRLLDTFPDVVDKYGPNGMFAKAEQLTTANK